MGRVLHFGVGNFFRAHQAWYIWKAGGWTVTGVSLQSSRMRDQLSGQGFSYNLVTQDRAENRVERIDVLSDILVAPENPAAVLDQIKDPGVEIISATVTEKGYHLTPDGCLNFDDPDIAHDLQNESPKTLIGYLARGLDDRTHPVTVLSCDNRSENGETLRRAVVEFAERAHLKDPQDVARFPNAMVDRITPATTPDLISMLQDQGIEDISPVPTEPFSEWVIEDNFAAGKPDWTRHGVQMVHDVTGHELRKLRMLNGAHSYLAYAGTLAGFDFVHEAVMDPTLRKGATGLMAEAAETLGPDIKKQAVVYACDLIQRFENPALRHSLRQIANDGSEKIRYRVLDTLTARADAGLKSPRLSAAFNAWVDFCVAETQAGRALNDPRADAIANACRSADPLAEISSLLGFDPNLLDAEA